MKIIKLTKNILRYRHLFTFINRVIYLNTFIYWLDRHSPRKGNIKKNGFHYENISEKSIQAIENHFKKSNNKKDFITENFYEVFAEIFNKFKHVILEYLGEGAKIDGISYVETSIEDAKKNISANWHTDNVGLRLKLFVCYEGDGSQPTYIKKNSSKLIFKKIISDYFYEVKRWIGLENKKKAKNQIDLKHYRGSAYIFDTNDLHRGSYEKASGDRSVMVIEFSTYKKHKFLKEAPIGTKKNYNSFKFLKSLLRIKEFKIFLDPKRIHQKGMFINYL